MEISGRSTDALLTLSLYFPLHFTSQQYWKAEMLSRALQMWKSIRSLLHHNTQPTQGQMLAQGMVAVHPLSQQHVWICLSPLKTSHLPISSLRDSQQCSPAAAQWAKDPASSGAFREAKRLWPSKIDETWKAELGKHRFISIEGKYGTSLHL